MKLPAFVKPSKALSKDGFRPVLTGAMVREEEVKVSRRTGGKTKTEKHLFLYVTDSYRFVRIDLGENGGGFDSEKNVPGPIPAVALKHMERGVNFTLGEEEIVSGITRYDRVIAEGCLTKDVTYPSYQTIEPEFSDSTLTVGMNPRLLTGLAEALGCGQKGTHIEITFDMEKITGGDKKDKGEHHYNAVMKVKNPRQPKAEGLFMPVRVGVEG